MTSIGELTTDICVWSLERQGFEVELVKGSDSLNHKLEFIYNEAQDDFLRVDADTVVNKNIHKFITEKPKDCWWYQAMVFDWWQQNTGYSGIQYYTSKTLNILRDNISEVIDIDRPESMMFRLPEFHNPRRCLSSSIVCGLHGYHQDDVERVRALKSSRDYIVDFDFELVERLSQL